MPVNVVSSLLSIRLLRGGLGRVSHPSLAYNFSIQIESFIAQAISPKCD